MMCLSKLKISVRINCGPLRRMRAITYYLTFAAVLGCAQVSPQQIVLEDREPEASTGVNVKTLSQSENFMVAAANPYAAMAGKRIIEQGGSAIDAAIAIQAMLTLVEPQSSGIGGGAFIMYWDNQKKKLHTFDGREVAPKAATPYTFFENGEPMTWRNAVVGGKSVGVPGVLKALELAHKQFGTLPWQSLFEDTIKQSTDGFTVSPRLALLIGLDLHPGLNQFPESSGYFKPNGSPLKAGELKQNLKLAKALKLISIKGADVFYEGELAEKIAKAVQNVSVNPGFLSEQDLANYTAIERRPMCNPYRQFSVCGMAPPSSGGVTVFQIIKSLEKFDLATLSPNSADFVHLFSQASALAFADRDDYVADLAFMDLSAQPLVNESYISQRAQQIGLNIPFSKANAGKPYTDASYATDDAYELNSTSHIAIVDKQGNAVSMTSSVEFMFGSGIMVEGFMLNNQLTDFSINPMKDNQKVLNSIAPFKRPRSAMSPTMVFNEDNELTLVVGSPGGSRIINYVAQTIINVLDFKMDIQQAIDAPRVTNRNDVTSLEKGTAIVNTKSDLEAKGHQVNVVDLNSGLHGIQIQNGKLLGGADPRREGIAVGQ